MWYNKNIERMVEMNFNERLKYAMEVKNIKQVELVERTGISKSGISQYLSGEYAAKQDNVFLLAKALDVDPAWLMGKNVPMEGIDYRKSKNSTNSIPFVVICRKVLLKICTKNKKRLEISP